MSRGTLAGLLTSGLLLATALGPCPAAWASVPHTVQPGETLWSISAANNFTTRTVAAFNGLSENATVYAGTTIQIPTVSEGAAALASAPAATSTSTASGSASGSGFQHTVTAGESLWSVAAADGVSESDLAATNGLSPNALLYAGQTISIPSGTSSAAAPTTTSSSGISLSPIPAISGQLYLRSDAAAAWNSMRDAALSQYGVYLYPEGPLGAYRTYDQQAQLYQAFLDGTGAPADPPGTSSHELGTAVDLATPEQRSVIDAIGSAYGWGKIHGPGEWWHVDYIG